MRKTIKILITMIISFVYMTSCESNTDNQEMLEISGVLKKLEGSTFQYGTHSLTSGNNFFALYSEELNLDDFIDQTVTIEGTKIEGYPIENGPDFINVNKIE